MQKNETLEELVNALKCLPGVGPKSALRMAYYLLQRDRNGAKKLSESIADALDLLGLNLHHKWFGPDLGQILATMRAIAHRLRAIARQRRTIFFEEAMFQLKGNTFPIKG